MAAATILNYYFVTPDHPRSSFAVLPVVSHQPNFASRISLGFEFQKDRLKNVGAVGVEFLAYPLTWHIAYTTAGCYRTSRDFCTAIYFAQTIKANNGGGTDLQVKVQIICERSEQIKIAVFYAELAKVLV